MRVGKKPFIIHVKIPAVFKKRKKRNFLNEQIMTSFVACNVGMCRFKYLLVSVRLLVRPYVTL